VYNQSVRAKRWVSPGPMNGYRVRLGKPFRGQPIALRATGQDDVFSVHFCPRRIGTIDLRAVPTCG
jgi:hypothetical protein